MIAENIEGVVTSIRKVCVMSSRNKTVTHCCRWGFFLSRASSGPPALRRMFLLRLLSRKRSNMTELHPGRLLTGMRLSLGSGLTFGSTYCDLEGCVADELLLCGLALARFHLLFSQVVRQIGRNSTQTWLLVTVFPDSFNPFSPQPTNPFVSERVKKIYKYWWLQTVLFPFLLV